jgi:murein DD-endopeptidase MepM/ murein hydrolase activator NlpD
VNTDQKSSRFARALASLVVSTFAIANLAFAATTALPRESRVPGGVALLTVAKADTPMPTVTYEDARVWVARRNADWIAVVGIKLSAQPGEHRVTIAQGGATTTQTFGVKAKRYPVQKLTLNKAMVDPPPEVMVRIERESAHLKTLRSTWRETSATGAASSTTDAAFVLPAKGPLSSRFGVARVLNGQPRSPHAGLDVAVATGTPVHAPADGVVIDIGDYYFCGKGLFIDHGNGKRGERVALSGGTGRSTAPHLHWSVFLNGVSVEPELFLKR